MSPWLNKTHFAWLLSQTWSWLYPDCMTWIRPYHCRRLSDFQRRTEICHEIPYFPNQVRSSHLRFNGCKNNNECVNVSLEKPFQVRSQIHSSSLSVNNKIKHCVSSALLLSTQPIKNLLGRVQEPPDPITRGQVGLGVEGHVPSAAP